MTSNQGERRIGSVSKQGGVLELTTNLDAARSVLDHIQNEGVDQGRSDVVDSPV